MGGSMSSTDVAGAKVFVYGLVCGDPSFIPFLVTVRIVCVSPER